MKIIKLVAENIKKIKAISIEPGDKPVLKITGANAQGKSSVLDTIMWGLGGKETMQEKPLRNGEKKGKIEIDLGDVIVKRIITEKSTTLELSNKDGAVFKSPQSMLNEIVGKLSFDPLKFAKQKKQEQVETLLSVVDLKLDKAKIEEISGALPLNSENPLEILNHAYKTVFERRTRLNHDVTRISNVLKDYENITKTEPVVLSDILSKRNDLVEEGKKTDEMVFNCEADKRLLNSLYSDEQRKIEEISDLQEKLKIAEEELIRIKNKIKEGTNDIAAQEEAILKRPRKDLLAIDHEIAQAEETNKDALKWSEKTKYKAELEEHEAASEDLTKRLQLIKDYKEELVASVKFPVDGLNFENGGITYQGIPFEQASSAQKLTVSLAVAMALNPKLEVIRIEDGSLLDTAHMAIIEKMAKDKNYQIWMECADDSGKVGIVIEDGEVAKIN